VSQWSACDVGEFLGVFLCFNVRFKNTAVALIIMQCLVRWRGGATGKAFGLATSRSRVQILLEAMLRNNLRQVSSLI